MAFHVALGCRTDDMGVVGMDVDIGKSQWILIWVLFLAWHEVQYFQWVGHGSYRKSMLDACYRFIEAIGVKLARY